MNAPVKLAHEWDEQPGGNVQRLARFDRVVVWARCARCRAFLALSADVEKPLIVTPSIGPAPPAENLRQAILELTRQLNADACEPALPRPHHLDS